MKLVRITLLTLGLTILVSGSSVTAPRASGQAPAIWPQWRGPGRDARIETERWPTSLQEDSLKTAWQVGLGPSYSGPIVSANLVFVTETKDKKYEVVRALDRSTGEQVWSTQWEGSLSVPFFAKANGDWIRSTPAFDGERLYVAGMRDVLVCIDAATGDQVWSVDFVEELKTPVPKFGFVCSPLVRGDYVYIQAGASFAKLEKHTGKVVWQTLKDEGGMYGSAFSSPTIANVAGTEQLLVQTRSKLAGVDPRDGNVLWSREVPAFRGMNILTPTVHNNSVFTSSYGGKSFLFDVSQSDAGFESSEAWANKSQGYMSSPLLIDGHAYLHLRNQRFTCIDLSTGQSKWTTKPFGKYWSMVANGDQILALDERGTLRLILANPSAFELIDERVIGEDAWAHLAVCGDEVFVRELNRITAFRWFNSGNGGQQAILTTQQK